MLEIKRVTDAETNSFTVTTSNGCIYVEGTSDFVVRCIKDFCENSEVFKNALADAADGETLESIADKMRAGGFDEEVIRNFVEKGESANA
jgi:hypothetical protein